MSNTINIIHSLTCISCSDLLIDPITLSCGYTICTQCFPISSPNSIKKSVFQCPAPHCEASTHLFGPELSHDLTISHLTQTLRQSITLGNQPLSTDPQSLLPLLNCLSCQHPFVDPITTPCGHTLCRTCVLQSKIQIDGCKVCTKPLPKFSSLNSQPTNQVLFRLVKELQSVGYLPSNQYSPLSSKNQSNIPLFVSGKVILPGQQASLSILTTAQFEQFNRALISSGHYKSLCIASVHRNQPKVAQFGTILQITNFVRQNNGISVHVTGLDRFKMSNQYENELAEFDILHEPRIPMISIEQDVSCNYAVDLAESILQCIQHLSQPSPNTVLHAQTVGLLGPLWLESMTSIHGPIPHKETPAAVCWWVASTLPITENDLYVLLRTLSLVDRLELVISWLQSYQSQWSTCRERAISAYLQVPQSS